jgi:integrase
LLERGPPHTCPDSRVVVSRWARLDGRRYRGAHQARSPRSRLARSPVGPLTPSQLALCDRFRSGVTMGGLRCSLINDHRGLGSGEVRGLVWDSIDLKGKRLFVEHQATRRRADDVTKTENSLRTVPVPTYLIPELKRWGCHRFGFTISATWPAHCEAGVPPKRGMRTYARHSPFTRAR